MASLSILPASGADRVKPIRQWVDVVVLVIGVVCGALIGLQLFQWVSDVPIQRSDFMSGTHTHDGQVYFRPSWEIAGALGYFLTSYPIGVFVYGLMLPMAFAMGIVEARETRRRLSREAVVTGVKVATKDFSTSLAEKFLIAALLSVVVLAFIGSLSLRDVAMIALAKAGVLPPPPHPSYVLGYFLLLALIVMPVGIFRLGDAFG